MPSAINFLKKHCQKIHFFGLGFIQIKISESSRWHFYSYKLPAYVEHPHNHRYDFKSTIFRGEFSQVIYKVDFHSLLSSMDDYIPTHDLWDVSCKEGEEPKLAHAHRVYPIPIFHVNLTAGDSYQIDKDTYHTFEPLVLGEGITIVERDRVLKDRAQVLQPQGQPLTCPFSQKYEEEYLWSIVEEMLK